MKKEKRDDLYRRGKIEAYRALKAYSEWQKTAQIGTYDIIRFCEIRMNCNLSMISQNNLSRFSQNKRIEGQQAAYRALKTFAEKLTHIKYSITPDNVIKLCDSLVESNSELGNDCDFYNVFELCNDLIQSNSDLCNENKEGKMNLKTTQDFLSKQGYKSELWEPDDDMEVLPEWGTDDMEVLPELTIPVTDDCTVSISANGHTRLYNHFNIKSQEELLKLIQFITKNKKEMKNAN